MPAAAPPDTADFRHAGPDPLSLALIDARNRTLQLLSRLAEAMGSPELQPPPGADACAMPPRWLAGHIGWFAERWIARHPQRARGGAAGTPGPRLASLDAGADEVWDPSLCPPARREAAAPAMAATRAYLLEVLEGTLDLLERAEPSDDGLYFFRLALAHEERRAEELIVLAQSQGWPLGLPPAEPAAVRPPLRMPATRWTLGGAGSGFCFAQETGAETQDVPEFEIDAQPVTWQQFCEFVDDGGYDRESLWLPEGWQWLQAEGRRAPRHVAQIGLGHGARAGGSVLQQRFGQTVRVAGMASACHLAWWEAEAWARWAGRRLATEIEWEIAAETASLRGFRWGTVHEWTAGRLHAWPGWQPEVWSAGTDLDPVPAFGQARVRRGASHATSPRQRQVRARGFALPRDDAAFVGFRTCAL